MKLIFVPAGLNAGDSFSPSPADQKHLLNVLRLHNGDKVEGSDGARRLLCEVIRATKSKIELQVLSVEVLRDARRLSLAIAKIDTNRFESAFSAAAQMAVKEVCVVGCERALPGPLAIDRLNRVARESAKQVGCPFLPELQELRGVPDLAEKIRGRLAFLMDPYASETLLESFPYELDDCGVMLIIGPVGDFTDKEKQILREAGAKQVQLCGEILRSETAAIVALGVAATCIRSSRKS